MEQALAVTVVFCLLGLTLWLLRAKGLARFSVRGPKTGDLAAVDRLPLGPQHVLHLVRVADRAVVLAISPAGCSVVESLPWRTLEEARQGREVRP